MLKSPESRITGGKEPERYMGLWSQLTGRTHMGVRKAEAGGQNQEERRGC